MFADIYLEMQQNIVALRPIRGEMFIEHATSKKIFLRSNGAKHNSATTYHWRKHCAPLERELSS